MRYPTDNIYHYIQTPFLIASVTNFSMHIKYATRMFNAKAMSIWATAIHNHNQKPS